MSFQILEEVTKTSIELLLKEPFYAHFFSALNKEIVSENSDVRTLAVGLRHKNYVLLINSDFWQNTLIDKKHRYGVVKHEILHLVFKHLLVSDSNKDHLLLNIAMDLVVNQYIDRSQLPKESLFLETFPELSLEKDQTYSYYYEKLQQLQQDCQSQIGLFDSVSGKNLRDIDSNSHGIERHSLWKKIFTQSSIEKTLLDAQIDNLLRISYNKTSAKHFGSLPAGIQLHVNKLLHKGQPLVDWRRVLKLFCESSSNTIVKSTLKRPSKRYGTNPGIKIKRQQKLLVALDTSGSISKEELQDFFDELHHIWKRGCEIKVIEWDTKIQNIFNYKGQIPTVIHGGGGTDFTEPILYANEHFFPDALIYFTDGHAPTPSVVSKCPILWVISKKGISPDEETFIKLPGRKAKLQ